MNRSEQINELAGALAKAQGQMVAAKKDAENPFFKSAYADLASVVAAIKKPLSDNGIAYSQVVGSTDGGGCYVETILMHSSGQWISDRVPVISQKERDPQAFGTAVSYMRRYQLQAIAGLPAEDDDGNDASGKDASKAVASRVTRSPDAPPAGAPRAGAPSGVHVNPNNPPARPGAFPPGPPPNEGPPADEGAPPEGAPVKPSAAPAQSGPQQREPRKRPVPSGDSEIDAVKFADLCKLVKDAADEPTLKFAFLDAYQFAADIDDDRVGKTWQLNVTQLKDERKKAFGIK